MPVVVEDGAACLPMAALPILPKEILQNIMHQLSPNTLSLVSRAWLPHARGQPFACIGLCRKDISEFLLLLNSPLCSFLPYVRQLYMEGSLENLPPRAQEIIFSIFSNSGACGTTKIPSRSSLLLKVKRSISNLRTPMAKDCHILNIVCLFPCLEHLEVQLMGIKSNIPVFDDTVHVAPSLHSLSVICNVLPRTLPPQWRHFIKWARTNDIRNIEDLYLTCMGPWNYEGAQELVNMQGKTLKHFHLGPQRFASQYCA